MYFEPIIPDYTVGFLFRSKTLSNTHTCSFRILPAQAVFANTLRVTTFALTKLARESRAILEALVFFGGLNLMCETD
jgi:hypothetical protein